MTEPTEPLLIEFPEPIVGWLNLPDRAGRVRGKITAVEVRDNVVWVNVRLPMWQRWSTQIRVGKPATVGISPGGVDVWAPAEVVQSDPDELRPLQAMVHERIAQRPT
ncbi:hypothetical protein [Streptomyces sp. NPDC002889]|uniref:hypothetical protein n=1 Tax=Streptomyces sp. NPDC002889 TaxID=3364669 RepID=UPI003681B299